MQEQWDISVQEDMGYVPQEGGLLEFLTVRQTFELFHGLHTHKNMKNGKIEGNRYEDENQNGNEHDNARVSLQDPWGELIGTSAKSILPSKYLNYFVNTLSGGNRKKLSVAISNINNPSLLAIDECTSGKHREEGKLSYRDINSLRNCCWHDHFWLSCLTNASLYHSCLSRSAFTSLSLSHTHTLSLSGPLFTSLNALSPPRCGSSCS